MVLGPCGCLAKTDTCGAVALPGGMNPRALLSQVVTPPIDTYEEKQSDYVYKVPVPCPCLKTEVVARREVQKYVAVKYHRDEGGPDNDMEAVKAGSDVEGPAVHPIPHAERCHQVLYGLEACKVSAEGYGHA